LLGDDLLDPTARDLAVQRRRQQMALALELGALAERPGPPAPEVRVDAALGATELQGGVVVLAFPLPDPDDDAAAQQRQRSGVAAGSPCLTGRSTNQMLRRSAWARPMRNAWRPRSTISAPSVTLISTPSTPGGTALVRLVDMGLLSRNGGLLATPKAGDSSLAEPDGIGEP
jgi:hypothetical protein